jgi:16S rRNA G966 N2-methylase RsmD
VLEMPKIQRKPSREETRTAIIEMLKAAPEVSDRSIARVLNCSPTTVGNIRMSDEKYFQVGHTETFDWQQHPYLLKNPDIMIKNLLKRSIRALKREEVLDLMAERGLKSAVYAERLLHRAERAALKSPLSGLTSDSYKLHVADIHDGLRMIGDKTITHIVCDPPYRRDELLPLLESLGKVANRVLTDDGVVLVMVGGSWLPEAMQTLGQHLRHWWQIAYITDRSAPYLERRKVSTFAKLVLMYVRNDTVYTGLRFDDLIKAPPQIDGEREQHEQGWGQSVGGFMALLEKFVEPSKHTVLDPFCGSGATLISCARLGIRAVGCDISERSIKDTRKRLDAEFAAMEAVEQGDGGGGE